MSEGRNADLDLCPENHEIFRFCVKKGKAKKKKFNFSLYNVEKDLGPGNKNWFENATAKKIQQKKQKLEDNSVPLCTPKDKIHSNQLNSSTSSSSKSSDNKFYSKIQRLLTSQTSTPSQTEGWQAPVLGASPDVVSGSAPLCRQLDIRKSLGVDMNDSMLSWTSSMATPTLMDTAYKGSLSPITKQQKGLPRVLFSPGPSQTDEELHALDNTSEENTDDETPSIPSIVRDTNKAVGTLISPDITVFQNINQQEVFNTESELFEHFPKTHSEEKIDLKSQSSTNFPKNAFKGGFIVDSSVGEESSMPLFSQDLYIDEIKGEEICSAENKSSNEYDLQRNNTSTNTGDGGEKCVSDALSDFFDPPSSAVGRRRCAPRKGKKRKLLDDSLNLEVCSKNETSTSPVRGKKLKTDLLCREDRKNEQNKCELQEIKVEGKQENKFAFENKDTEQNADSPSLNIQHKNLSIPLREESICLENCSTPNNAQKVLKSILSSKKTTTEGSAVLSNKKVRFCLEEKSSLKRNLTQLDDEDYVSPVFDETLSEDDLQYRTDSGICHPTETLAVLNEDSTHKDMAVNLHKLPRKGSDMEMCDELFSQVSPTALNEMCSVATSIDRSNPTRRSNLGTGSHGTELDETKLKNELKKDDLTVSVKTEGKQNVTSSVLKTDDEQKVTLPVHKEKNPIRIPYPSNPLRSSISLKSKPRKFLYPSTNQISKSCPQSVYGFAEQSEKNMKLTMSAKDLPINSIDTPQDSVIVQDSSSKADLEEKHAGKNQREQLTFHRGIKRNIGFESFSSLANNRKVDSETDRSDVIPESRPETLHTKLIQSENLTVKPKSELRECDDLRLNMKCEADVHSSNRNTPLTLGLHSGSEGLHVLAVLKTESFNANVCSSEHFSMCQQNNRPKYTEIKTEVPEAGKPIICEIVDKDMLQLDLNQVVPDKSREHCVNYMESETTSTNKKTSSTNVKMFQRRTEHAENQIESVRNTSSSVHEDGDEVKHVPRPVDGIVQKCTGFTSASGKSVTFSEQGLNKAKQLLVSVDSDTGVGDDSSLCFSDMNSLKKDGKLTSIDGVQTKHEMKLPSRTCTISKVTMSDAGKTTSVNSTPECNITSLNLPAVKASGVDFEDMLEGILKCRSSPEVSRHTPLKTKGSRGEFRIGQDKNICLKKSHFETVSSDCKPGNSENTPSRLNTDHTVLEFKGFTTAGGKRLQLSKASLKKASALLDETDTNCQSTSSSFSGSIEEVESDKTVKDKANFSTAGEVSKKALMTQFDKEQLPAINVVNTYSDLKTRETRSSENTAVTKVTHLGFSSKGGKGLEMRNNGYTKDVTDKVSDEKNAGFHSTMESGCDGETVQVREPGKSSGLSVVIGNPVQINNSNTENTSSQRDDSARQTPHFHASSHKKHISLSCETDKEITAVSDEVLYEGTGSSSEDREKENVTDSDSKKRVLLKVETCKGLQNVSDNNNFNKTDESEVNGISTAAAKKQKLDLSLKEGVLLMDDVDKEETDTSKDEGISTAGAFGGFSTARGKKLKVSSSSLKKAFSPVAEVEGETTDVSKKADVRDLSTVCESEFSTVQSSGSKSKVTSNANDFGGFSSAGGKKFKLSDASLKKAMSLVAEFDDGITDISMKDRVEASELDFNKLGRLKGRETTELGSVGGLGGFSTASGRKLNLSDASLKKAISLVAGVDESTTDIASKKGDGGSELRSTTDGRSEKEPTGLSIAGGLGGFSTAGGKKLQLSESSIRKAMLVISDIDGEDRLEKSHSATDGFQTAGSKHLQLSKASTKKSSKTDVEGMKDSLSSGSTCDSKSEENKEGKGKPVCISIEEESSSDIEDILNLSKRSGSSKNKDKGLQPSNSRKSSSRFPPGANIPKGFRPFKPPKITKKPQIEKANSEECVEVSNKVVETTKPLDKNPSTLLKGTCGGEIQVARKDQIKLQTASLSFVEDRSKDISQVSKADELKVQTSSTAVNGSSKDEVQPHIASMAPNVLGHDREITPVLKLGKGDQDIESSIMDELFSEELESSQHFSPGSGKVLRSQGCTTKSGDKNQRPDTLPSEEYEQFLDIEDMALCKATEIKCEQSSDNESPRNQTTETFYDVSVDVEMKSLTPIQHDRSVPLEKHLPAQQTGFSGFQSASGKTLSVSEEALKLAKQNFDDLPSELPKEHLVKPTEDNVGIETSGFKSASGNTISISEDALSKANQEMNDDSGMLSNDTTDIKDEPAEMLVDSAGQKKESKNELSMTEPSAQHIEVTSTFSDDSLSMEASRTVNKSSDSHPSEFRGFQSASGKKVHVSEEALVKAEQSIADWCSGASEESPQNKTVTIYSPSQHTFPEYAGFQSASGKKVGVSEEALVRARQNFKDWSSEVNIGQLDMMESSASDAGGIDAKGDKSSVTPRDEGLCRDVSSSGDKGEVKEEEWTVPKLNSFQEIPRKTTKSALVSSEGTGGQEQTSLQVQSDHFSLQEVMNSQYDFSQDDSNCDDDHEGVVNKDGDSILLRTEKTQLPCTLHAIQTEASGKYAVSSDLKYTFPSASGKQATVLESSVKHARNTLEDAVCSPFQSASGKQVNISKNALENAKETMEDVCSPFRSVSENKENISKNNEHARQTVENNMSLPFPSFIADSMNVSEIAVKGAGNNMEDARTSPFQSASGKQVKISKSALEHAKQSFEDVGNTLQSTSEEKNHIFGNALQLKTETIEEVGASPFQSASGKKVNISNNALEQARQTLEEIMSSPFQSVSHKTVNRFQSGVQHTKENMNETEKSPFQSASGKKVNISDSALQHAKKTFQDLNNCPFQSASGNAKAVSSEALKQARIALSDNSHTLTSREPKNVTEESSLIPSKKSSNSALSSPFQTATGGKIMISDSSLQHVRKTKEDLDSSYHNRDTGEVRKPSSSCDVYPSSVQQTESSKLDKVPRMKYQMIKEVSNVQEKQSSSPCEENFITPSKQKQHFIPKCSKIDGGPIATKPRQQSSVVSPCVSSRTDRRVFIEGMDHSIDEFCQPDDFLEEMEVTPKRRQAEEKAVSGRSGMVKPMKSVPEAFTRDRQGTSCSLRACFSKSTPTQKSAPRLSVELPSPTDGVQSQPPVKSSFLTPYKKSDMSETSTNPDTYNTANQASRKPMPRFIPKCLSLQQTDLGESKTTATLHKEGACKNQQKTTANEKSENIDIAKLLEEARKHQAELLKIKEKTKVSPDPGRLYTVKIGNRRLRLRDVIKLQTRCGGKSQHNRRPWFGDVRAATAVQHKFYLPDFYTNFQGQVYVGDGAYLVPDDQLYAGKEELFRAFSTLPGVDCKLISDAWFYNHYRWLVWKLASYEVTSPYNFAGRALTPEVVMLQMKYRYDREIDNCQRSALKKIMERDDTASKRMVLCVSGINCQPQSSQTEVASKQVVRGDTGKQASSSDKLEPQTCVELTDGWYSITARLDVPLTDLVNKRRIGVGHKLCISGAELVGSQDACTPLEAPASLMLKLNANSTRPAAWDARLGYQNDPRPLCISLSGLYGEGGSVGCLDVILARKYPQMYMEKLSEGGCVFRTGQAEDRFQHQHQRYRQEEMEKLYAKLQTQFEVEDAEEKCICKKKWTQQEVELLQTGHEIYEAYSTSRQPDMIEEYLSDRQRELLLEQRRIVQDEKQQKLHAEFQKTWQTTSERTVIPLMKMKVVGCSRKDMDSKASTTVTVWRPSQDVMDLSEGTRYKIFGMNASSSKSRYKQFDVQLTATRQTRFLPVTMDENLLDMIYEPREVMSVRDIQCRQPLYGEADFVGMVVSVSSLDFTESGRHQEIVYAVDANSAVLGIKFWGGLKSFSLEDVLSEGRLFCASNLMDKSAYRSSVLPLLEASLECSIFTQASQYPAQRKALDRLKSVSTDTRGFLKAAKQHLSNLQQQKNENTKKFTPEKNYKQDTLDPLDSILKTPIEGNSVSSSSTPSSGGDSNMPPSMSKQSYVVYQARMSRLLNFGSPTPLSPLVSKVSPSVSKDFKPPVLRRKSLGPNH